MKREDIRVKIPALLHLTRLGYGYLPGKEAQRDKETNILAERLRAAVERINGAALAEETFQRMMADLRCLLREGDLGQGFYRAIRDGWNGLKLVDFDHPEQNEFLAGAEIACGTGRQRFRPDITLFINGMPLGMMEVKAPEQRGGLKGEYERMCRRFSREEFRPYLQAAQVWLFSNDRESGGLALLPRDGAYFTGGAPEDFPVYPGPEKKVTRPKEVGRLDPETARAILRDNGMAEDGQGKEPRLRSILEDSGIPEDQAAGEARAWMDPGTPTHRMLTGLAAPERFLFLIRYGILYERGTGADGRERIRKRMLNWEQMAAIRAAEGKIQRGYRNWKIPCPGKNGRTLQGAALITLMRERMPGRGIYWVAGDETGARKARTAFKELGLDAKTVRCLTAAEMLAEGPGEDGKRICVLPAESADYRTEQPAGRKIRAANPGAILITMGEEARREGTYYTYLLQCADGSLYCGWTDDLEKRVRTHNAGQGAKYTRSRLPVRLVYWERYETKQDAMRREWRVKRLTREEKIELVGKGQGTIGDGPLIADKC